MAENPSTGRARPSVTFLRSVATVSIADAGAFLGLSTSAAYRAADREDLRTIKVNGRRRCPTPHLLQMVGLPYEVHDPT